MTVIESKYKQIDENNVKSKVSDFSFITAPRIDKLAGVVDLHDQKLCEHAFGGMISALKEIPCVEATKTTRGYAKSLLIYYPDAKKDGLIHKKGPTLHLQLTHWKNNNRSVRFEYNPSDMSETGEEYLDGIIQSMFAVPFYSLLHYARFTRVDIYRDIQGRNIMDMLIGVKWSKTSQSYVRMHNSFAGNGQLQSITFGKGTGNQTIAYDKAAELNNATTELTRIEVRHKCSRTFVELQKLPNVFERIQVYSLDCKGLGIDKGYWKNFQDACRLRGVNNAIRNQPVAKRAPIKKALPKKAEPWWDITESEWPKLMAAAIVAARLNNIPDYAEPLSYQFHIGQAA
jgi:hypothetical protein